MPYATKRYLVHFLPTSVGLSPTFSTIRRVDTGAVIASPPSILEAVGAGMGQGLYYFDWPFTSATDPDVDWVVGSLADPTTLAQGRVSVRDVPQVFGSGPLSVTLGFNFLPNQTGLSPAFSLFKRTDTWADVSQPTISELGGAGNGGGFYTFPFTFGGAGAPDIAWLVNGNAPGPINPSLMAYGSASPLEYYPQVAPPVPPALPAFVPNPLANLSPSLIDFGQDFSFLSGLDPNLGLVSGLANLGQALAHRLETPRGGLFYDGDYGTDVRGRINDAMTPAGLSRLASDVNTECRKDERVLTCISNVQFVQATSSLSITLYVTTAAGPFQFVLAVTEVSVALLEPSNLLAAA